MPKKPFGGYTEYKVGLDGDAVREVIHRSGLSYEEISRVTGVPVSSIATALRGRSVGISLLLTLADYFGVSLDCLCGREKVPEEFEKNFMYLRRLDYEASFRRGQTFSFFNEKRGRCRYGPYPYNLLDCVCGAGLKTRKPEDCWQSEITPDQEAGLSHALSLLPERTQEFLWDYFFEGCTLEEIGEENDITRERVRQIIGKGIRQLRHPILFNSIMFGLEGNRARLEKQV